MASSTTPPKDDPISSLFLSDTFYTWFTKTDTLIDKVNPIEVYSITADLVAGRDGVTIGRDGNGNHTIGYILPATIPNDHLFTGDIVFTGAVTGNIVNQYNGITGNVIGVSSISGTGPIGNSGLVTGVILQINGVTGTSFGHMTLDGKDIPDTVGSLSGPAGYILNAAGGTGFTYAAAFFTTGVTGPQIGMRVDPVNNQVAIATATIDSDGKKLRIDGGKSGGILLNKSDSAESDIRFADNALMTSNSTFEFRADTNAANSGSGSGVPSGPHFTFSRDGSTTVLTVNENGKLIAAGNNNSFLDMGAGGGIGVASGSILFKSNGSLKFGVNSNGALLAGGTDTGDADQTLISQGSSVSKWSTRFYIRNDEPTASDPGDNGAVWYQV